MTEIMLLNPPSHDLSDLLQSKRSKSLAKKTKQIFPLGLLSIGEYLKSEDCSVDIHDLSDKNWVQIEQLLRQKHPDIMFLSCLSDNRQSCFKLAKLSKEINPGTKIVLGNIHASCMYEQILENYPVDYIVMGEGEITCYEIVKSFENGIPAGDIKGIAYKENGELHVTEPRPLIKNLDDLPFPKEHRFTPWQLDTASMMTSRGCPYGCIYCSTSAYWNKTWRYRSSDKVMEEIDFLVSEGAKKIVFFDDHFTLSKKRVIEICERIKAAKYDFDIEIQSRVDRVDKEILQHLSRVNCIRIMYGIETMSPTILTNINKQFTVPQIIKAFELSKEMKIPSQANIMIGNPGETQETINETIQGIKTLNPDYLMKFITMVYPNTQLYQFMKSKGKITDDYWLSNDTAPFHITEHTLEELRAYSLQVQIAWYKQKGIIYSAKDVMSLLSEHGASFAFDYFKDALRAL